jgi:hypothetical protein
MTMRLSLRTPAETLGANGMFLGAWAGGQWLFGTDFTPAQEFVVGAALLLLGNATTLWLLYRQHFAATREDTPMKGPL